MCFVELTYRTPPSVDALPGPIAKPTDGDEEAEEAEASLTSPVPSRAALRPLRPLRTLRSFSAPPSPTMLPPSLARLRGGDADDATRLFGPSPDDDDDDEEEEEEDEEDGDWCAVVTGPWPAFPFVGIPLDA